MMQNSISTGRKILPEVFLYSREGREYRVPGISQPPERITCRDFSEFFGFFLVFATVFINTDESLGTGAPLPFEIIFTGYPVNFFK